ncbi:MAG: UDP-forming cellulose synthase catalytic subunit [Desulfobacteraceae bacterium]|nr:MAG: UDP-forming cellulose synthase catalytic subunit [Desulfobacteraceae bacterium]
MGKQEDPDTRFPFLDNNWVLITLTGIAITILLTGIVTYFPLKIQATMAWGLVLIAIFLKKRLVRHPLFLQSILMAITIFMGFRYFYFRSTQTLVYTSPIAFIFVIALFSAELYALVIQLLGMFVNSMPMHRKIQPVDLDDPDLPTVDVLIPTYSEPEQMVAITASSCSLFDYPKDKLNIYILDDGGSLQKRNDPNPEKAAAATRRHETLKTLAEFLEVEYRTRAKNYSAKAGNINEALYGTSSGQPNPDSDLVVILDCDHVPTRDFLRNTVGNFIEDPKLFLLQTPHFFINPDPVERNLNTRKYSPGDNEMFYCKVLPGLDFWDAAFFCGSAAVLRRKYLDESEGIAGDTITEDAETALFLHGKGYNSAYIDKPMVCGLSPETFEDFIIQRNRWAQGMIQILLLKNPIFNKGLSLVQKICYLNTCAFWFFGLARFMFMIAPFLFLYGDIRVYHATVAQCFSYPIPYLAVSTVLSHLVFGKVRHPFFSVLYEMVLSLFNIPAVLSVLRSPHSPTFAVTPKGKSTDVDRLSGLAYPFYILLILFIFMYPVALFKLIATPGIWETVAISVAWGTYNFIMLLLCLVVVWEKKQIRKAHRIKVKEKVEVFPRSDDKKTSSMMTGYTTDISEGGMGIILDSASTISQGDHVDIKTTDSKGKSFCLWAKVQHTSDRDGKRFLGCQFQYEDELSFYNTIDYIYGDSNRWDNYWKNRQINISYYRGLTYILKRGIIGIWGQTKGLRLKAMQTLQKQLEGGCNKIRAFFTN